jgi:serine/threonine protein kinase
MDTYVVRYVCAAHWAYSRQILCRKEISYSKMSPKEREQLQAELSILKELVHPNIVRYYEREHLKASQDLHLYMEYCGNGDLGRVIQKLKNNGKNADEEFVWSIFSQIVSALYRCHHGQDAPAPGQNVMGLGADAKPVRDRNGKPMILHRDLKPENSRSMTTFCCAVTDTSSLPRP